jgi:hypothetical protein
MLPVPSEASDPVRVELEAAVMLQTDSRVAPNGRLQLASVAEPELMGTCREEVVCVDDHGLSVNLG